MKTLLILICSVVMCASVFADQNVTAYTATTAQSPVKRGCVQVTFVCIGFTGTIGNSGSFTSFTGAFSVVGVGEGKLLGAIPYTVAGQLQIIEVR